MLATTTACAVRGLGGVPVRVEADVTNGLPNFTIVGLTDRAIQEARERVRAAIKNSGFVFPARRVTVNLAPAEVPKEGTGFDLAIAMAILGTGSLDLGGHALAFIGELALDGGVRPVAGVLPMVRCLRAAGAGRVAVPEANSAEAALVAGVEVLAVSTLRACVDHVTGESSLPSASPPTAPSGVASPSVDLAHVRGQGAAKRALEIAAAGGHNLLMVGPPGAGKTMLAKAFPSLLPDLDGNEALDVAAIYSLHGSLRDRSPTDCRPPFRAPHHSVSRAGLVGGGTGLARPGELSLAHRGVLFLDEVCEFPRSHLEALRQPLEDRTVTVVRARGGVSFPADLTLVAAANPCPCGHAGESGEVCGCDHRAIAAYRSRLSGPVRDRIDLVVNVPRQPYSALFAPLPEEASAAVRARVEAARVAASARVEAGTAVNLNVRLGSHGLIAAVRPTPEASRLLATAGERLRLSARAFFRVLKVARTIADLGGGAEVDEGSVAEAIHYRGGP